MHQSPSPLTLARARANAPTSFELRTGYRAPRGREPAYLKTHGFGAPPYDPTANARANPARTYHVETAWEAMLLTPAYSGERKTFKRWAKQ